VWWRAVADNEPGGDEGETEMKPTDERGARALDEPSAAHADAISGRVVLLVRVSLLLSSSSAGDLGKEKHLAVGGDRLEQRVLVDLAVDRHRHAVLEVRLDRRMEGGELLEELLDGRRREVKLGDAARQLRKVTDQDYPRHFVLEAPSALLAATSAAR
jgi:hypothetical protein